MGGLFSAPKPDPVVAPPATPAAAPQAAEEAARQRALDRARRGLSGTIATQARGVLDPVPGFALRKTLLGE